jgi:hypothetical protein
VPPAALRYYSVQISIAFALGLLFAIPVGGMFFHEMGHFIACRIFGLEVISVTVTQVIHVLSKNPSVNLAVGFAGGLAQALFCFVFVLITGFLSTAPLRSSGRLEDRLETWSWSIGFESAFLTIGFTGLVMAFWEGLFADSYSSFADNIIVWIVVTLFAGLLAFWIAYKTFPPPTENPRPRR